MQINMLKHAASIDMQHVVSIYLLSLQHDDFDTADYILLNYADNFNLAQRAQVEAFITENAPADVLAAFAINKAMQH